MEKETKHTPEWKFIEYGSEFQLEDGNYVYGLAYGRETAELIVNSVNSAQTLKAENQELKERIEALLDNHGLTKAKIETIALQTELSEMKKEREELIQALETCSKKDDKYSYIVAKNLLSRIKK